MAKKKRSQPLTAGKLLLRLALAALLIAVTQALCAATLTALMGGG